MIVVLRIDIGLVQPTDGNILVGNMPVPRGYRIRAINLRSATAKSGTDVIYTYLGVSRGDGGQYVRCDDMSHVNELLSEKIVSTLPLDLTSDGELFPSCYVLQSSVSKSYELYFVVLCETG